MNDGWMMEEWILDDGWMGDDEWLIDGRIDDVWMNDG